MWQMVKLFLKWLLFRILGPRIAALLAMLPLAFILKAFGLPLLIILLVVGLPVFFILAVFGLPIIMVLVFGTLIVGAIFAAVSFGLVVLKALLPILIVLWLLRWLWSAFRGRRGGDDDAEGTAGRPVSPPPPPPTSSSSSSTESTLGSDASPGAGI